MAPCLTALSFSMRKPALHFCVRRVSICTGIRARTAASCTLAPRCLPSLSAEIAVHGGSSSSAEEAPASGCPGENAAAGHAGRDATAASPGRTSLRRPEVPHFRPSAILAARTAGSANRNQSGYSRQRWVQPPRSAWRPVGTPEPVGVAEQVCQLVRACLANTYFSIIDAISVAP